MHQKKTDKLSLYFLVPSNPGGTGNDKKAGQQRGKSDDGNRAEGRKRGQEWWLQLAWPNGAYGFKQGGGESRCDAKKEN